MKLIYNENINIETFNSLNTLAEELKQYLVPGNIALSGGSTYLKLLKIWSEKDLNLDGIDFYPVDERVVDFDNEMSNWGNTYRDFLSKYSKNRDHHFTDAIEYANKLNGLIMNTIFLGVGDDGHTASLFTCDSVFTDNPNKAVSTISPKPPAERVSMSGDYIVSADNIIIIFLGEGKKDIVNKVINGTDLPITTLLKAVKKGIIYIDSALMEDNNE